MILTMANKGIFDEVPTKEVRDCCREVLNYIDLKHGEIAEKIETEKVLTEEISKAIIDAAHEFMETKN